MLLHIISNITLLLNLIKSIVILSYFLPNDPLEQFEVVPFIGTSLAITNLSLVFIVLIVIFFYWFSIYDFRIRTRYDFLLNFFYNLVFSITRENLYIRKQQYFSVLFYLFLVILGANLIGMLPYSFTSTSSFVVTFFIALMHFIAINHLAAVTHKWHVSELFLPSGAPLEIAPFLIFIEAVSYVARVFSLSIRLFANMLSGHALLKILIGFS